MCGGGGGGDDARIRFEEAQDQADIDRQVAELNAIFGNTGYDYQGNAPAPMIDYYGEYLTRDEAARRIEDLTSRRSEIQTRLQNPGDGNFGSDDYYDRRDAASELRALEQQLGPLQSLYDETAFDYQSMVDKASANEAARSEQLWGDDGLFSTLQSRYGSEITDQRDSALDSLKVMLAKRGAVGTDFESEAFRKLGELYDENVLNWGEKATSHVRNVEAQDQAVRNQLRADIEAGGSLDTEYALSALEGNIGTARQAAFDENLSNLFAGLGSLYGQQRDVDAYNRGYNSSVGVGAPGTAGSTGTVLRY